jgi:TolB-like protein/TolA-binding protein
MVDVAHQVAMGLPFRCGNILIEEQTECSCSAEAPFCFLGEDSVRRGQPVCEPCSRRHGRKTSCYTAFRSSKLKQMNGMLNLSTATVDPHGVPVVRGELQRIFASEAFKSGKRAQEFLELVVEHALAGQFESLRERMLGVEMFGRPVDYDTANDAVVRVKANEVRRRLSQYYRSLEISPAVRIELPPGSYVPHFSFEDHAATLALPSETKAAAHSTRTSPKSGPKLVLRKPKVLIAVAACALAILVAILLFSGRKSAPPHDTIRSIAVLPLENLSGDPKQEYFADGMTEELITELGKISELRVISRTSVMTYKGTKKKLPEIAHELGVEAVVEGSVERENNQVRITAQLIDARTDRHLWANSYVRDQTSILSLQDEVAQAIADAIRVELTPQERIRLQQARPVNWETEELYFQSMQLMNHTDYKEAYVYLQRAIDSNPNYAPAHAALARVYEYMGDGGVLPSAEAYSKQKAEALKAIGLDNNLAEAHAGLASALMKLDWDWSAAEKEYERALELNPNSAPVYWEYTNYLYYVGRTHDAVAETNLALLHDPVASLGPFYAGVAYYFDRQYDRALDMFQLTYGPNSTIPLIQFYLGDVYTETGKYDEAIAAFQKAGGTPYDLGHIGNAYARWGRKNEARAIIPKLEDAVRIQGMGRYEIAMVYAGLGEDDEAFDWLEKAFSAHDKGLMYLKIDPTLDPLRSDPRFSILVRRVGLPQ